MNLASCDTPHPAETSCRACSLHHSQVSKEAQPDFGQVNISSSLFETQFAIVVLTKWNLLTGHILYRIHIQYWVQQMTFFNASRIVVTLYFVNMWRYNHVLVQNLCHVEIFDLSIKSFVITMWFSNWSVSTNPLNSLDEIKFSDANLGSSAAQVPCFSPLVFPQRIVRVISVNVWPNFEQPRSQSIDLFWVKYPRPVAKERSLSSFLIWPLDKILLI